MKNVRRSVGWKMMVTLLCSILLILLSSSPVLAAWPHIIFPSDAGITLVKGRTYTIQWGSVRVDPVNIELCTENIPGEVDCFYDIAVGVPNSGSYSWTVPSNLPNGSNYVIGVGVILVSIAFSDNTFTISDSGPPPPPPLKVTLISPAEGAAFDNGCPGQTDPKSWDFSWGTITDASKYHLYVIGPGAIYPLIDNLNITDASYQFVSQGYVINQNRIGWTWRVRAFVNGVWREWSETRSFDVEPLCSSTASWSVGSWDECSALCEGGTKTRDVECKVSSGNIIAESYCSGTKPSSTSSCNIGPCPTVGKGMPWLLLLLD